MNTSNTQKNIIQKINRAKSFYNNKDFQRAGELYSELCKESPDAETHYMMGVLYVQYSNRVQAEQHLSEALRYDSDYYLAWNQLGIIQATQGKYELAITSFNKVIEINPKNVQAFNNLGNLHRELGNQYEAESAFKKALQLDKNSYVTVNNIANIYLTRCEYDKAESYYKRAIKLNKNYFDAYYNLGATYQSKGEHKLAINYYKRAHKLRPEAIQPLSAIANSYEKQGKLNKALEYLNPLIAKNINTPDVTDVFSKICLKNKNYDEGINFINRCLATHLNPINEQALHFSLGDIFDKKKEYDDAFKQYALANTMRPYHYDKIISEKYFDTIKQVFSDIDKEHNLVSNNQTNTPIFIIGMPRSGTSLIEQILSSHSEVYGAGELPYISELAGQPLSTNKNLSYPECIKQLSSEKLNTLADTYLSKLKQHGDSSHYISDKMPHNFLYIGLIHKLFPNSKIIHCLRNPLDVCLSVYFHNFNQNHPYSDNLNSLGHYYNQYRELMTFWHQQYNDLIIDIAYEDLLSNAEITVNNMLQHVDLQWEDSCLKYYENKRTITTPSYAQATQPLYTSSMDRWKNYSTHLDELRAAIDDKYLL